MSNTEPYLWSKHEDGIWQTYSGPYKDIETAQEALASLPENVRELYSDWKIE